MYTDSLFPNLTITNLINKVNHIDLDFSGIDSYLMSYHAFVNYFKKIKENKKNITSDDLVIGIHFTYGWMPTIFEFRHTDLDYTLRILNTVQAGAILTVKEFAELKRLLNNSIVGSSKLLHFINPDQYAIWDSRVYRFVTGRETINQTQVSNIEYFDRYLKLGRLIAFEPLFESQVYKPICEKLRKYQDNQIGESGITKMRALEMLLYLLDIQQHSKNRHDLVLPRGVSI